MLLAPDDTLGQSHEFQQIYGAAQKPKPELPPRYCFVVLGSHHVLMPLALESQQVLVSFEILISPTF